MQKDPSPSEPSVLVPVMAVAEVQDSLLVVMHDLGRLEGLLSHTMENLMLRFDIAHQQLSAPGLQNMAELDDMRETLRAAVTELQFQDMASQLIVHTTKLLQGCAARLALETMGNEEGEEPAPFETVPADRPNPVTQSEMEAGSIELF